MQRQLETEPLSVTYDRKERLGSNSGCVDAAGYSAQQSTTDLLTGDDDAERKARLAIAAVGSQGLGWWHH